MADETRAKHHWCGSCRRGPKAKLKLNVRQRKLSDKWRLENEQAGRSAIAVNGIPPDSDGEVKGIAEGLSFRYGSDGTIALHLDLYVGVPSYLELLLILPPKPVVAHEATAPDSVKPDSPA